MEVLERANLLMHVQYHQSAARYLLNHDKCELVMGMLEDDASRAAYKKELCYNILKKFVYHQQANLLVDGISEATFTEYKKQAVKLYNEGALPHIESHDLDYLCFSLATSFVIEQYRYFDLFRVEPGDVFLDCGACVGDTAFWALHNGAKKVYSFEMNPENIRYLQQNRIKLGAEDSLEIIERPVSSGEAEVAYKITSSADSMIAAKALDDTWATTQSISLDSFCTANSVIPTFIKMDIEGAEMDALCGAVETIRTHKPKLAICLYHDEAHMWEIPLLVKKLVPEYKFYFKKNASYCESILYATL